MLRPMVITQAGCYEIPIMIEDACAKDILEFIKTSSLFNVFEIRHMQLIYKMTSSELLWGVSLFDSYFLIFFIGC